VEMEVQPELPVSPEVSEKHIINVEQQIRAHIARLNTKPSSAQGWGEGGPWRPGV
jgi:hypothetical protein